jgi:azurin
MKSKTHIITSACIAALIVCGPSLAFAATKKSAAASPAASASPAAKAAASPAATKAPRAIPFRGKASAVDQSAKTFTIAGKEHSRVFKVTNETKITKEDKDATFADLTDDTKVTGSYWKKDDGTLETKSLKIGGKMEEKAEATPASKKSKKSDTSASPTASPKK